MPKDLLAKYYYNNKERLPKKAREIYQSLSKEKKREKSDNMVMKGTKSTTRRKKTLLSIKRSIIS